MRSVSDARGHAVLLLVAIGVMWFPTETHPFSLVFVAGSVLALCTWGWSRRANRGLRVLAGGIAALGVLIGSAVAGWDLSRAADEIGLLLGAFALAWLASRSRPPEAFVLVLGLGIAGLAVWGIWQAIAGIEALRSGLEVLPEATRAYAEDRVNSHRAYASLPFPGHLAVLLATAVPLLVARVKATPAGVIAAFAVALAVAGLAATRSPIGIGLAIVAVAAVVIGRFRRSALVIGMILVVAFAAVVAVRPDVARLEPVELRVDNWRTAGWLWATSPVSGVGVASFAQASQALPLEVGNRPAHAHGLPFEALAELGPVGLLAWLLLTAALGRVVYSLWNIQRPLAVAIAVVPLHNLVDFSFFVSGVALPWAVLAGWGLAFRSRDATDVTADAKWGRIGLVTAASLAVALTILQATSIVVEEAAAASPISLEQFHGAERSLDLAPWRVEPQFLLATAAMASGDRGLVDRAWLRIDGLRWVRPRSAALAERRARLALARGDVSSAMSELWAAAEFGSEKSKHRQAIQELTASLEGNHRDPPD